MNDPIKDALSLLDSHPCSEAKHMHRVALAAVNELRTTLKSRTADLLAMEKLLKRKGEDG